MKTLKISLVLLLTLIIFSLNDFNDVEATDTNITWILDTTATEHHLEGSFNFDVGTTEIIIHMPDDIAYILDNGNEIFDIKFYATGILVDTLDGNLIFGDLLTSQAYSYQFNLDVLNIDPTANKLVFILPLTYTDSSPADAGFLDYVNDNTTTDVSYTNIPFGLFRFYWSVGDLGGASNYLYSDIKPLELGTQFIGFRYSLGINYRLFDEYSKIYFYDTNDILIGTEDLISYVVGSDEENPYGSIDIPLLDLAYYEDITQFKVRIVVWQYTPSILYNRNNQFLYIFDGNVNTVNFYSESEIVYTHKGLLGSIARYPQAYPTKTGEIFSHWITANGVEYNWTAIDEDMLIGNTVNFYAVFEDIPDVIDISVIDPTADETSLFTGALTNLGFNDPISRTIVFGFLAVMTAGFMFWKGISVVATVVVVGIELFFFMYLGLIPMFVSIIIILLLIFIGWGYKGVVNNE